MDEFVLNLTQRDALSTLERGLIAEMTAKRRTFDAKTDIVKQGSSPTHSCLMVSGYSARVNLVADGRRRITAVHVPGDFVDLHSLLLSRMDHSVTALNSCEVALVPHNLLRQVTENHGHLSRLLWMLTAIDAAIYRQWLVASGRLSSVEQLGHFLCEMALRLRVIDKSDGKAFRLPMSQAELGDAMGLSVVHVNRGLQQLRRANLITWRGDAVQILNFAALQQLSGFDPTYLDLERRER
ncbi:Crp/Fnr family transcriptional regulator [Mesorhizobium sp. CN2-181]|uniref:Crp/Fnr family transcriptional regulator n=1 Tax=Mesorhizobium yinganensis TaxID=3157707 RepID=UPI0032B7CF9D